MRIKAVITWNLLTILTCCYSFFRKMSNVTNSTPSATDVNLAFNHVLIDIAFSLTIIISLIANTTAIYILYERNKQNTRIINFLLKNLSSANILSAIGIIPLTLSMHIKPLINETNDTIICNFIQGTSFFITSGVSLLTLCVISYSRYSSLDSMRRGGAVSKTKVKIACALVWLISVILLIPSYQTYSYNGEKNICVRDWGDINGTAYSICIGLITFTFPIIFLFLILLKLRDKDKKSILDCKISLSSSLQRNKRHHKFRIAQKRVHYLIASFLCSWAPFLLYWNLANTIKVFPETNDGKLLKNKLSKICILISTCNMVIDPFLYGLGNTALLKKMKCTMEEKTHFNLNRLWVI